MPKHLATVVALLALVIAAAAGAGDEPGKDLTVEAEIARYGQFFGFGFGALWFMSGPKLVRIDADDNVVSETLIKGASGQIRRVAFGEDAVWLADTGSQKVYKVDPDRGTVLLDFYADIHGFLESTIAIGDGSVWVVTVNDRLLERFDVTTGEPRKAIPLPAAASAVVFAYQAAWVIAPSKAELYRVEPETNAITDTIPLLPLPRTMAAGEDGIWVLGEGNAVQRIDPTTRRVVASIGTKRYGWGDIAVGGGYVWFSVPDVFGQIDPQINRVVRMLPAPGTGLAQEGHSIRYGDDSLWLGGMPVRRLRPPA